MVTLYLGFLRTAIFRVWIVVSVLCMTVAVSSCSSDNSADEPTSVINEPVEHTLFMYLPWSTDLTVFFQQNIIDMEQSIIKQGGLKDQRVVVFMSTSATDAKMFEITYSNGSCRRRDIKTYTSPSLTTTDGISAILSDVVASAPARHYAMTIGCHGMGWLPVNPISRMLIADDATMHWDYRASLLTRYFGGRDKEHQTDISTLADAIKTSGLKMDYILFDDCYMATVEVAYELKDVTDHLVASTCEVMAYGMPYALMGQYMMGEPDYEAMCREFYGFYSTYDVMPCGTLSVTDCSQLDALASVMKDINQTYVFNQSDVSSLQALDGYAPTIFYDYGDYVDHLVDAADAERLNAFQRQLSLTVPYKVNTPTYYAARTGRPMPIHTYSGLTISDPSVNSQTADKNDTAWFKATH